LRSLDNIVVVDETLSTTLTVAIVEDDSKSFIRLGDIVDVCTEIISPTLKGRELGISFDETIYLEVVNNLFVVEDFCK
jgi:hypothetical protein